MPDGVPLLWLGLSTLGLLAKVLTLLVDEAVQLAVQSMGTRLVGLQVLTFAVPIPEDPQTPLTVDRGMLPGEMLLDALDA